MAVTTTATDGRPGPPADPRLPPSVEWRGDSVRFLDQRCLPEEIVFVEARTVEQVCDAVRTMTVRGAPALGVTGAFGIALAAVTGESIVDAARMIIETRPTAVNLAWGVRRAVEADDPLAEAFRLAKLDESNNRRLGAHGAGLIPPGARVYTHCHTGALATAGYGTALGIVRAAHEQGRRPFLWVGETRPALQGARLTAWEARQLGIPATLVADVMAGCLMASGEVECVLVGADRIAANGDVANKVGTYGLAVLAAHHRIPFYVAAPTSTIDFSCPSGAHIPIERRSGNEVRFIREYQVTPDYVDVENRAFDITPAEMIAALITEDGIVDSISSIGLLSRTGERHSTGSPQPTSVTRGSELDRGVTRQTGSA